jgi:hypothetical protein
MDLTNARQQCHHAVQLNTHLARGFIPAKADDSHTSLVWLGVPGSGNAGALTGQPVDSPSGRFRLALIMASLTVRILDAAGGSNDTFSLDDRTWKETQAWLAAQLKGRGLNPAPLSEPLHFSLDDHPLAHGARFSLTGAEDQFQALALHYAHAAALLEAIRATEPRASATACWPHHFDIATRITLSRESETPRTIGVGLSPGDHNYPDPYYYVAPWPYPEPVRLRALKNGGFWNTHEWTGAVLSAGSGRPDSIRAFLLDAIGGLEEIGASAGR